MRYFTNSNNENLELDMGFEQILILTYERFPVDDISADTLNFDVGVRGEEALFSGVATIINPIAPQKLELIIPANTFTKKFKKLQLQVRWTPNGENERIVTKRFLDVGRPITPKP